MIFINREVKLTDSIGITNAQISPKLLETIRAVPGVTLAEPIQRNHFPASVEIGGGAIPTIASEIFLESIPSELFNPSIADWYWKSGDTAVPILVPRQFLNLYNFGFAPGKGLPPISENAAMRVSFKLIAYPSHGGPPVLFSASIAGFSDQIESILVPTSFLTWANHEFGTQSSSGTNRIAVALENPDSTAFHNLLEKQNLVSSHGTRENARLQILLDLALVVIGTSGICIVILILLLHISEAENVIAEHQERILKLYFLGHPPSALIREMITIRLINCWIPAIVGLSLVWLSRSPIISYLESAGLGTTTHPSSITLSVWGILLVAINLFLLHRVRVNLTKLYQ